ncbi:MAG TPA: protein-L-isoaspartate(D-aspartate) O-methyltransferase [Burkholderiales bacterium]|nr:protein-L-isoaspartate(D-aspartate) O-methyltransferase [Burkholderiales bacterium]
MVEEVRAMARDTRYETGRWSLEERVLAAMARVPRHRFVPSRLEVEAYENRPLPIGHGQTISQPFIVALMTELLRVRPGDRVLEIGTGSGYQAAVLAELGTTVYTIEIVEPLGIAARDRLVALGYGKVEVRVGDGYHGWEEHAPFDAIMVTAAASHVPPPLVRQLKAGGRMVVPVGPPFLTQSLMLVEKKADGTTTSRQVLPVRFVPLTGGH